MTIIGRTFRSGNSDAVRLPKGVTFGAGVEVEIKREGDVVTLVRKRPSVKEMLARLRALPKPQTVGVRDEVIIPERDRP